MPTSKGALVGKDFVRFFKENSTRRHTLLSSNPSDTGLWELIFKLRFGSAPEPGQGESFRVKRGSTDPRWEFFLHQEKALRIVFNLRKHWLKKSDP